MANNFSGDTNCVALWRFESGALTTDSKGTNTLTDVNTVAESTGAGGFKEGACAADLELGNRECFTITDAALDAGFPLKSGDANKKISVCCWFEIEAFNGTTNMTLVSKYDRDGKRSFAITCVDDDLKFLLGYNSGASVETVIVFADGLDVGVWYHLGFTYQDSDKSWYAKLVGDDVTTLEASGNTTNNINVEDGSFGIGTYFYQGNPDYSNSQYDGLIDEVVIFKDILSEAEIDAIRAGTYGAVAGWPHKFLGVSNANIGKILGVSKANIGKVIGVA